MFMCFLQYFYEKHKFINKIRIIWICNEIYPETHKHKLINKLSITWIHYAGSRTDFWGKNRAIFSGELFSGEEFLPRTAFSGKKCRSILSNQLISLNYSGWSLPTREGIFCQNVFSSWKRRNTPRFRTLLFGKEAVKTFFYKCSNSGKMNPLHSQLMGTKL